VTSYIVLGKPWTLEEGQVYETASGRLVGVVSAGDPGPARFRNFGTGEEWEDSPEHFLIGVENGYYSYVEKAED
jgi:hypothetical protein